MIISQDHGRLLPSVLLSSIRQDFYAKPVAYTQPSSAEPCPESTPKPSSPDPSSPDPSSLEQAMIPQQTMMKDALSPHMPLPANADVTVTGTDIVYLADLQPQPLEWLWQHRPPAGTLAMLSAEPTPRKTCPPLTTPPP